MKRLLLLITICISSVSFAQQPNYEWAKSFGASITDEGFKTLVDDSGNVYTCGQFRYTVDFDPGPGIFNLNSWSSAFLQKLDANGNFIWAVSFGSMNDSTNNSSTSSAYDMCFDNDGNIIVSGGFSGTGDFDPGPGVFNLTSGGNSDTFILKLDENGNFIWAKNIDASGGGLSGVKVDSDNDILIFSNFQNICDFDPGPGTYLLDAGNSYDCFVLKLNSNGEFQWVKTIGSNIDGVISMTLELDQNENICIGGYFSGDINGNIDAVDFDPGPGVFNMTPSINTVTTGDRDGFVVKLDNSGNFLWAKQLKSNGADVIRNLAIDNNNNIILTGYFQGQADFDPGIGTYYLNSILTNNAGIGDVFVWKLSPLGDFIWAKKFGGTGIDQGYSIYNDEQGSIYSTGFYQLITDFDPGPGVFNLTSAGDYDIFIQKLDSAGLFQWALSFGSIRRDAGFSIQLDNYKNIYLTGYFSDTVDFDPGPNLNYLYEVPPLVTAWYNHDGFTLKLNQCISNTGSETVTECDSYTWSTNGQTYTQSGQYTEVLSNQNGCDSTVTLNLTITNSNSSSETVTECDSYTWATNGQTYTQSGQYTTVLTNAQGCDSTVTLDLTITQPNTGSETVTECNSYTWNTNGQTYTQSGQYTEVLTNQVGCDSTVTLNLTITNSNTVTETITECVSYTWNTNGQTYTQSGQYTEVLTNQNGCDSTVILDLTINSSSSSSQTDTGLDSYTWSVNNQTYTQSGTYTAVIPNASGCDSTITLDLTLQFTGLDENESSYVAVYPNPTFNSFTLSTKDMTNMNYTLVDLQGKVVLTGKIESSEESVDISHLSKGQYNLVFEDESISPISIIKN